MLGFCHTISQPPTTPLQPNSRILLIQSTTSKENTQIFKLTHTSQNTFFIKSLINPLTQLHKEKNTIFYMFVAERNNKHYFFGILLRTTQIWSDLLRRQRGYRREVVMLSGGKESLIWRDRRSESRSRLGFVVEDNIWSARLRSVVEDEI